MRTRHVSNLFIDCVGHAGPLALEKTERGKITSQTVIRRFCGRMRPSSHANIDEHEEVDHSPDLANLLFASTTQQSHYHSHPLFLCTGSCVFGRFCPVWHTDYRTCRYCEPLVLCGPGLSVFRKRQMRRRKVKELWSDVVSLTPRVLSPFFSLLLRDWELRLALRTQCYCARFLIGL